MVSIEQFNQMSINDKESMKFVLDSFGNVAIRVRNMGWDPIPTAYNASVGTLPVVGTSPAWYIISTAGTLPAPVGTVKVGDIIVRDGSTRTAIAFIATGNVTGPVSSMNSTIALFNGITGKIIKDSTILLSSLQTTLTANVDYLTPGTAASTYQVKMIANQNYVTDAQLVVIGNTSWTNTGDETATTIKTKLGITTLSGSNTWDNATNTQYSWLATSKQDTLVSGTNIKTINGNSILWSWDLSISWWHIIETAWTPLTQRTKLNFIWSGVTVSDGGAVTDNTIVTINTWWYTLPTASATVLGWVKIGSRLTMTGDILSADATDLSWQLHLDQTTSQTIANWQPIRWTLTASQLLATDASKKMQSLDVATYPSLTELSYVKWVTSWIQAQINGKADTATATTSANWLAPQATAPSSGLYNYLWITNWETAYTNKALFDTTVPVTQAFWDAAAVGTAAVAARRDHKHAMMAAPTTISGNAGTATALQNTRAIYGNNFDGTAALTQIIASTYGGTGNGFTKFSWPTTSEKTFTLPDANTTLVGKDANANLAINNLIEWFRSQATAAGTTTLVVWDTYTQIFTGSAAQTCKLPTTWIVAWQQYYIVNQSTWLVTVQSSWANTIVILWANTAVIVTAVVNTPTTASNRAFSYNWVNAASGKVATINNTITLSWTDAATYTFPGSTKTLAANDWTNRTIASQAIWDLAYASSTTAYTRLAAVAAWQVLISAWTGTAPAWSANPYITTLELWHATDTTISRVSAWVIAVEWNNILTTNTWLPLAWGTMTAKVTLAWHDEVGKTYTPATGSQTVTIDCSVNNIHIVSWHASGTAITFAISNCTNSQPFIISILQWWTTVSTIAARFSTVRWAWGSVPTLTATINKRDTFWFIRTWANTYDGFVIGQNC